MRWPRVRLSPRVGTLRGAAAGLLALGALVRLAFVTLPGLAEPNYEEALVGLMARRILQGDFMTFWWGHPYLGTVDVYVAAALFHWLAPVTAVLRLAPLVCSLAAAWLAYLLARALWGPRWALLALAWWALPPAFLLRMSLTPYEYTAGVALGSLVLYLAVRGIQRESVRPALWLALGLTWGLALWDHLVAAGGILASAVAIVLAARARARPAGWGATARRVLGEPALAWSALGFLLGNLPFWAWNASHRWETLAEVVTPAVSTGPDMPARVKHLVVALLPDLLGRAELFWGGPRAGATWLVVLAVCYGPVVIYAMVAFGRGPARRVDPGRLALWLVAASFVFACLQLVLTHHHLSRYLMPLYSSVAVLFVGYVRWLAVRAPGVAVAAAGAVLALHAADTGRLWAGHQEAGGAGRPVSALIDFLHGEGVGHVSAHFRVAWPIGFAARERVVAADFHDADGFLVGKTRRGTGSGVYLQPYFDMADAVDLAPRVALVTHEVLRKPAADELVQALALLGAAYDRHRVGDYTVFLNFRRPVGAVREVPPAAFTLRASHAGALAGRAVDRNIETAWHTDGSQAAGMSLEVALDRPRPLARVVLDPGGWVDASPRGLRVEVSEDGRAWHTVVDVARHLGGIDWLGDHPRLSRQGHLAAWWRPAPARYVRLTQTTESAAAPPWAVAELLLYEAVDGGGPAAPPGLSARDGQQVLDAVTAAGIRGLYSFDEANVWFTRHRAPAAWRAKPLRTVSLHDPRPPAESGRAVRFHDRRAFFLREASPALEARLAAHGVAVERRDLPAGVLYVTSPRRGVAPLYWAHQQLLALDPS
jgi:hypothetical protein